jgi:sugar fermentation stimulation protein A
MHYPSPLIAARLIRRYKRFLADVRLDDGNVVTAHCANTGAMTGCMGEDWRVWLSKSTNPKRKLAYSWELTETPDGYFACVNTARANALIKEAIKSGVIHALQGYETIRSEVRHAQGRLDLLLENPGRCYVEIKNVTLLEASRGAGQGFFPDAVSQRGTRQLGELRDLACNGARAVVCFCVTHSGIEKVSPARHIDPAYSEALQDAIAAGVEVIAYGAEISPTDIRIRQQLTVVLA